MLYIYIYIYTETMACVICSAACVICSAIHPARCSRFPGCQSGTSGPSPLPPSPPPIVPSPAMRKYDDWYALEHGRHPPPMLSYIRQMTKAEFDAITQVRAKAAEDKEKQQSNLITWSQIQKGCCVNSDGVEVEYSKHLKIVRKIYGEMNKKPLRAEFDAAFLAAIKPESK
jgi:hypothetical protein